MATSSLRRQVKNIVHNYSEAEVKVREATSNDPWGPSTTLMNEIAQMTYTAEFPGVMMMVWRRLNDSGKNWRHVYKGLTLLDYLIKNGSNKVVQECNENIIAVQTLKDFQFLDRDGKDHGINVREKAKQIVSLLKDDERIKQERAQAQTTRKRLSQVTAALDSSHRIRYNEASVSALSPELEHARPQSTGEEELQLQLALAMSKEESEKKVPSAPEEEEIQLQAALNQSKEEYEKEQQTKQGEISLIQRALLDTQLTGDKDQTETVKKNETHLYDLIDIFGPPQPPSSNIWDSQVAASDSSTNASSFFPAWGPTNQNLSVTTSPLPWDTVPHNPQLKDDNTSQSIIFGSDEPTVWQDPQVVKSPPSDPWGGNKNSPEDATYDIFSPPPLTAAKDVKTRSVLKSEDSFEMDLFGDIVPTSKSSADSPDLEAEEPVQDTNVKPRSNTPELFLEPAARSLVNLDSLVSYGDSVKPKNPFFSGLKEPSPTNPFQYGDQKPSLNQIRASSPMPSTGAQMPIQNISLLPTNSMDTGMSNLRTISPVPSTIPLPVQLQSFPSIYPSLNFPYAPVVTLNQLPAASPQPILPNPNPAHTSNNPFL
ncbi:epsin-3 isoform 1-T1 [Anomaloglossus baeobatrachus]|uniref:epsin-3 isoform X1 n=1 Tax=Anomaloglossus baeobatrachus TaxID=238106 RepID=UPI003F4F9528